MNYLKKGLFETLKFIKNKKGLFTLLVALQLLFVICIVSISIIYQVKIYSDATAIISPLEQMKVDEAALLQGGIPMSEQSLLIYKHYSSLIKNVRNFLILLGITILVLYAGMWSASLLFLEKKKSWKKFFTSWMKNCVALIVLFVPLLFVLYNMLMSLLSTGSEGGFTSTLSIASYVFILLYYVLLAAMSVSLEKSWKKFALGTIFAAFQKIHKTILVLLINAVLIGLSGYLLYLGILNEGFLFLALGTIVFIVMFVLTRLFWIACIKEIYHEKNNH